MIAVVEEPKRLVSTGVAAKAIGVDGSTLWRWMRAGVVKPSGRTMGGQYRWDVEDLQQQMREHFHAMRMDQREAARQAESPPDDA